MCVGNVGHRVELIYIGIVLAWMGNCAQEIQRLGLKRRDDIQ
jgi:hypothetical protein